MRKKNDTPLTDESDSFLKRIRGQIRLLGFAAVGSLVFIGIIAVIALWRSNVNANIMSRLNTIANYQYEISTLENSTNASMKRIDEILDKFEKMDEAAQIANDSLLSAQSVNDIRNISRDIKRLSKNYKKLAEISETRGYTTNKGLYKEYTENDEILYSTLSYLSTRLSDKLPSGESYLDLAYNLTTTVSNYSSGVLEGNTGGGASWLIYGVLRTLERSITVDSAEVPELKPLIHVIEKSREIIMQMISLDSEYITIHNNNAKLFEHLSSITTRTRTNEESVTSIEQNSLLIMMAILIVILVTYIFFHTQLLRRDLSQSITMFNELLVAKAANDAQSSFLSTVSHEIRTPINAIMGMNEIIIRESQNKQIERYALEIKDSSRTLLSLVNDLLDSSRLDADKLKIIPVEYDLASSISDLTNMITSRAKDKNLNLFVNVNDSLPHILFGDEIRIKQCVLNLLTNAVKYTETGSITLNVDYESVNRGSIILRFQVIDTGIGMKEEDINHIYERFSRFDEKRNRNIEGTGLGMNIVNRLLDLMGTKLEIQSIYGKGSDFSFGVHQGVIDWEPIGDYNTMYEKSLSSADKYHERFIAPAAHVLIVDDMQVNLTVFKGLLKKTKVHIDTALSGKTAIEMIKNNTYDIVFLDHRMPKMDGIETLMNIRELANNPNRNIPYIALTANAIAGARELYINAGFTDYLSKPIESSQLEAMLIEYLPKEIVELSDTYFDEDDDDYSSTADDGMETQDEETAEDTQSEDPLHKVLMNLEGIDYSVAIENCIDDETLTDALRDFIQTLETKPAEIERYWREKDYRNYTIQVHALKSTARLIGATKLSDDAKYLEQCGDAENVSAIDEKTDDLLNLYESYSEKLRPFVNALKETSGSESTGEPIPDDMFADAINSVKELVDSFDFGNAEGVLMMLKDYDLTDAQQIKYDILYKHVRNVDRDAVLAWYEENRE